MEDVEDSRIVQTFQSKIFLLCDHVNGFDEEPY